MSLVVHIVLWWMKQACTAAIVTCSTRSAVVDEASQLYEMRTTTLPLSLRMLCWQRSQLFQRRQTSWSQRCWTSSSVTSLPLPPSTTSLPQPLLRGRSLCDASPCSPGLNRKFLCDGNDSIFSSVLPLLSLLFNLLLLSPQLFS